jgi:hypothetical protein
VIPDKLKAQVLLAVAQGASVADAARGLKLTPSQGRDSISRLCRDLRLPSDVQAIRANPVAYISAATRMFGDPKNELHSGLRYRLQHALKLRATDALTPEYLSNLTASAILSAGLTTVALSEIQDWLVRHEKRLRPKAPKAGAETREARRAMFLLDSFGFDVRNAAAQLAALDE